MGFRIYRVEGQHQDQQWTWVRATRVMEEELRLVGLGVLVVVAGVVEAVTVQPYRMRRRSDSGGIWWWQ